MKKIYSKPEIDVRIIEMSQMIALSTTDKPANPSIEQDAKRRRGIFDEKVEDERESIIW